MRYRDAQADRCCPLLRCENRQPASAREAVADTFPMATLSRSTSRALGPSKSLEGYDWRTAKVSHSKVVRELSFRTSAKIKKASQKRAWHPAATHVRSAIYRRCPGNREGPAFRVVEVQKKTERSFPSASLSGMWACLHRCHSEMISRLASSFFRLDNLHLFHSENIVRALPRENL
jgi:hypothetical protein